MYRPVALPLCSHAVISASHQPPRKLGGKMGHSTVGFGANMKKEVWRCVKDCGACCKLAKGPSFATPEEIFDDGEDVELYRSLVGEDGWCIHYEKSTRTCSIYSGLVTGERPYFCRVDPDVFYSLYGIHKKNFNKEACSSCRDTIKTVYGSYSAELHNFNQLTKTSAASAVEM